MLTCRCRFMNSVSARMGAYATARALLDVCGAALAGPLGGPLATLCTRDVVAGAAAARASLLGGADAEGRTILSLSAAAKVCNLVVLRAGSCVDCGGGW
jgi:hypothetical protein